MSQLDPAQSRRRVEPVPYAGVATPPRDALTAGHAPRAILCGGIALRLIGAYTLVECRPSTTDVLDEGFRYFTSMTVSFGWRFLVVAAYVAWGVMLVLRGPRLLASRVRQAPAGLTMSDGAEWSAAALAAAGAVVILWTFRPLLGAFSGQWEWAGLVTTLAQLALGAWLFLSSGRVSSIPARAAA